MCGIFGVWHQRSLKVEDGLIEAAFRVQAHRGPDGFGLERFEFGDSSLAFAHQRLSIIDLTEAGRQPMGSEDRSNFLSFNGELYNYIELREQLRHLGVVFKSSSDTEVMLAALLQWGVNSAIKRFNWMGAFAWLDLKSLRLVLACDAGSEKPLYYFKDNQQFIFASEIKTVLTLAQRKFDLDRDVIGQFIYQGLTDASSQTFFRGINRLQGGNMLEIDLSREIFVGKPAPTSPLPFSGDPSSMKLNDFIEQLRMLFLDSVRIRMRSDVPLGVLLSGGIDSSAIAAASHKIAPGAASPHVLS